MSVYSHLSQPKKRTLQSRGTATREELNLHEQFSKLQNQYSKLENRYEEATSDVKKYKNKADTLERDLTTTRKTLEKLIEEKYELEQVRNEQKLYVRKLESKISQGAKGHALSELNTNLQSQVDKLEHDKKLTGNRVRDLEAQVEKLNDHIIILSRALEIKAEEFGLKGDIRSTLLFDVGQCRDELEKAQMRDHEISQQLHVLLEDNEIKTNQVEELRLIRESNNEELNKTLQQLVNLQAELETFRERNIELTEERTSVLEFVENLRAELTQTQEELAKTTMALNEHTNESKIDVKTLKAKLKEKESALQEIIEKYNEAASVISDLDSEVGRLTAALNALLKENNSMKDFDSKAKSIIKEKEEYLEEMHETIQSLQTQLVKEQKEKDEFTADKAKMESKLSDMMRCLEEYKRSQQMTEEMLKEKMEKTLYELEELVDERDQLREGMNEAINKCASTMMTQQTLERERTKLLKQVENLKNSKGLLQKTMTEQLNSLRSQFARQKQEKEALEERNKELFSEVHRLRAFIGK